MASFSVTQLVNTIDDASGVAGAGTFTGGAATDGNLITRWAPGQTQLRVKATASVTTADINGQRAAIWWRLYRGVSVSGAVVAQGASNVRSTAGTLTLDAALPSLDPDEKYYLLVRVVRAPLGPGGTAPNWEMGSTLVARSTTFWTNRSPAQPVITSPPTGISFNYGSGADSFWTMTWDHSDEDAVGDGATTERGDYGGWAVQIRRAPEPGQPEPQWDYADALFTGVNWVKTWGLGPSTFGTSYRSLNFTSANYFPSMAPTVVLQPGTWQIRVQTYDRSAMGASSPENTPIASRSGWSDPITIYIIAPFLDPIPLSPRDDVAVPVGDVEFEWQFRDPRTTGGTQDQRQLRIRKAGEPDTAWQILAADPNSADDSFLMVNGLYYTIEAGYHYEWQVATRAQPGNYVSGYSQSAFFWATPVPNSGPVFPDDEVTFPDAGLGCGVNRAFLFRKGGEVNLGEITDTTLVDWSRLRDDISQATVRVSLKQATPECRALLAQARSWLHEVVIFRDNGNGPERVWEGPITRITYTTDGVEIAAQDVMAWPYRRILRNGYNDSYRVVGRTYHKGGAIKDPGKTLSRPLSVVTRAMRTLQNCLAYDDPNVLAYLNPIERSDDAKQSRIVPPHSRTAFQDVDDLAAKSGLDYTVIGRRIVLWDTHNPIGTLPEMRDGDFDSTLIVTEYGMQAANVYGVTNNNGIWGLSDRLDDPWFDEYGYIEMLVSAYGESDEQGTDQTLTAEAAQKLREALGEQAERGIGSRWPVPVHVRVPDNSTLSPDVQVGINQLVPGVFIPLRSDATLRSVSQMQKLDSMRVTQTEAGETVKVTLSPAPRTRGEDPDAEGGVL